MARHIRWAQRNLLVAVVYLPPGGDNAAAKQETLGDLGATLRAHKGPYLVAGEWNQSVQELEETGFPSFVEGTIIHPRAKTCTQGSGTEIDYCIASNDAAGAISVGRTPGRGRGDPTLSWT